MELCNSLQKQQQEKIFTEAWLGQWPSIREYKFTHKLYIKRKFESKTMDNHGASLHTTWLCTTVGWSDFSSL